MAAIIDKENLSPLPGAPTSPTKSITSSPAKAARKGRSKSIGLEDLSEHRINSVSPDKNRRKSSFAPLVKSILPSKEDEAKRRAARRKSLANRRVSFAPEATLHTWDVIEYMREATTSSTNSTSPRRSSRLSNGEDDSEAEVPATPDQGDQSKRRRRSSVIPPLNFNDPEDVYSSSPANDSSPVSQSELESDLDEDIEEFSEDDASMSLISAENTADMTLQSNISAATSDSSARLDAALRQAAETAGTRGIEFDEYGYQPEQDEQDDAVETAQAWAEQENMLTPMAKNLIAFQDQENVNPFSPAFRAHAGMRPSTIAEEDEDEGDMSMDMTRAVGRVVAIQGPDSSVEDATMDFTQVAGQIYQPSPVKSALKRRRSTSDNGVPVNTINSGEVLKQPSAKRRRSSASEGGGTMDLTTAFGAIRSQQMQDQTMDFTMAVGSIMLKKSPVKTSRRQSVRRRRSSVQSTQSVDQTMDFTMAVGNIRERSTSPSKSVHEVIEEAEGEDSSMDFTVALGHVVEQPQAKSRPTTPERVEGPVNHAPTTPTDQGRFRDAKDLSAKKLLTPILVQEASGEHGASSVSSRLRSPLRLPEPQRTPSVSPQRSMYPDLSAVAEQLTPSRTPKTQTISAGVVASLGLTTPERSVSPVRLLSSPFKVVPMETQEARLDTVRTPRQSPVLKSEPSPSSSRRSPTKPAVNLMDNIRQMSSPVRRSPEKPNQAIINTIRTMSTPRKEVDATPLKRLKEMTPKVTPKKTPMANKPKTRTPAGQTSSRVQFEEQQNDTQKLNEDLIRVLSAKKPAVQRITLEAFLNQAGIKFMDLTASKRRYTAAPTPRKATRASVSRDDMDDAPRKLTEAVVTGATTLPELDLYAHSCRELKRYISEGKQFLRQLESDVATEAPAFMTSYADSADKPAARAQMDRAMMDVKTRARLQSKEIWYSWRSQLLDGLQQGLSSIESGLSEDENELLQRDELIQNVLPAALTSKAMMVSEISELEEEARLRESEDATALSQTRADLLSTIDTVEQQKQELEELQRMLQENDTNVELLEESKAETLAAIKEANLVKEASRGVSLEEARAHHASLASIQQSTGWAIASAIHDSLTLKYKSSLQLYLDPGAFSTTTRSPSKRGITGAPISLTHIGDSGPRPEVLTTEKRFFLQLLRAQLQMLDQSSTSLKSLLRFVASSWDLARDTSEILRRISLENPASVSILSDESLGVDVTLLLPQVQTKVSLAFELGIEIVYNGAEMDLSVRCDAKGRVVYGEQYKESKMGEFLAVRLGKGLQGADAAIAELRGRLEKTGRKI